MQNSISRRGRRLAAVSCAAAALAAGASTAPAHAAIADLRVEAGGQVLTNASYTTSTETITTDRSQPACGGTGQTRTIEGLTALGLLAAAAERRPPLQPLRISDKFSFGLLVCGVFDFISGENGFWLYKVDHRSPEVGGEAFKLRGGEEVLWYFQDTTRNRNTGDELVVDAPVRAAEGRDFQVTVYAYDFAGRRRPAAGARVLFGERATFADAAGRARGRLVDGEVIRAGRRGDIPSAPVPVCIGAARDECGSVRGKRIVGGDAGERIKGTRGSDVIRSGDGNDRIDVRGGSEDRVRCGDGRRDRVRLSADDRATRDCEIVNGRRRQTKRQ